MGMHKKCSTCGSECEFDLGSREYVCACCGNHYGVEDADQVNDQLNYANAKRIEEYDFEGALQLCLTLLKKYPDNQEANWCAILAEYQIVYLKNARGEYKPTFLHPDVTTPIPQCAYYDKLNSTYQKMADFAETVRLEVIRESKQIPDYDVFISYKQHVNNSDTILTEEANWAEKVYNLLKAKTDLKVFYDEKSLKNGTAGWEPHIYSALKSAKYLILLGSSIDNLNSTWVKNEWQRFLNYRKKDTEKTFSVVGSHFKPEELDYNLQSKQMIFADQEDWADVLIQNVIDYFTNSRVAFILKEAEASLEKRDFKKAKRCYAKVCCADKRNAKAYWGLLMCRLKAMDDYDLVKSRRKIVDMTEYKDAVRYADGTEKEQYEQVGMDNLTHQTARYERKNYQNWKKRTKVKRTLKRGLITMLILVLCAFGVHRGYAYLDQKAKEYVLVLDFGESADQDSSVKAYLHANIPDLPGQITIEDKGYMDFVGWFTEPDCKGIQVSDQNGKSDLLLSDQLLAASDENHRIRLHAGFEVHQYRVAFYDDDGHTLLKSVETKYGTDLEEIGSNLFVGDKLVLTWSESLNGSAYTENITRDLSLYATSFAIKVNYDTNGGSEIPDAYVRVGDKIPMPIPEREYYGFAGWTCQGNAVQYGYTAPEENISLVAQWSKTHFLLMLDSNGGLEDSQKMVKAGTLVSLPVLTRSYYKFLGWEYNGSIVDNSFVMPEKDVSLTAKWERTHYRISLNGEIRYVKIGESVSLPSFTKTGYTFKGWLCNGNLYTDQFTPTGDAVLTPSYGAKSYVVTLNANGGTVSSPTQMVTYDSLYTLPVPTRDGYEFIGWYTSADKSGIKRTDEKGAALTKWNTASDATLYAIWLTDYTIAFDRQSCKQDNGYNPTSGGTEVDAQAHSVFEIFELICRGGVQNSDGSYYVPSGEKVRLSVKVCEDILHLPTYHNPFGSMSWTVHEMTNDDYKGEVYGTNIKGKQIGYGAYFIKVTYANGTYSESNKVNFLNGVQKDGILDLEFETSQTQTIAKIEVVVVYEVYYDYWMAWSGSHTGYANWRCSATLNFK